MGRYWGGGSKVYRSALGFYYIFQRFKGTSILGRRLKEEEGLLLTFQSLSLSQVVSKENFTQYLVRHPFDLHIYIKINWSLQKGVSRRIGVYFKTRKKKDVDRGYI